ncbi:hypothetical protein AB0B31_10560 [Catellatospora citrea]|uniref:dTMP kinase n=1 Tax=Catellatospora citrea TaxID=53366 RepID=UPI0033C95B3D
MTTWISIEGINGVGKTHFARLLARRLADQCKLLEELTDTSDPTASRVISAMATAGDPFLLRTGHPLTETFAFSALKVREYERVMAMPQQPAVVIEDRGLDTIAVYQAVILAGSGAPLQKLHALAGDILQIGARWRQHPDLTVLLTADLDVCIGRYVERTGVPVTESDRHLLARVDQLYRSRAAADGRWWECPVSGRSDVQVLDDLQAACGRLLTAPAWAG